MALTSETAVLLTVLMAAGSAVDSSGIGYWGEGAVSSVATMNGCSRDPYMFCNTFTYGGTWEYCTGEGDTNTEKCPFYFLKDTSAYRDYTCTQIMERVCRFTCRKWIPECNGNAYPVYPVHPTKRPTDPVYPTNRPTLQYPTKRPTPQHPHYPTKRPTPQYPTRKPTLFYPTKRPTLNYPTKKPTPFYSTRRPTPPYPTTRPTPPVYTAEPTAAPTVEPSPEPTTPPTAEPTAPPTAEPTVPPTRDPTAEPTVAPTLYYPTKKPTDPLYPTKKPTDPFYPTKRPTDPLYPTKKPTLVYPTKKPTNPLYPMEKPTDPLYPTFYYTKKPANPLYSVSHQTEKPTRWHFTHDEDYWLNYYGKTRAPAPEYELDTPSHKRRLMDRAGERLARAHVAADESD